MFNLHGFNFDFDGDGVPDSNAEFIDTNGDGIVDTINAYIDSDGDGIPDSNALFLDTNGDGSFDQINIDTNHDGAFDLQISDTDHDGIMDTTGFDSNNDGIIDTYQTQLDTDHDGIVDTIIKGNDYNQDGIIESQEVYRDSNHDGSIDEVTKRYDSDGDGIYDKFKTFTDLSDDGNSNVAIREEYQDRDGDGKIDTYVFSSDTDSDGVFEMVEVYDYNPNNGTVMLKSINTSGINQGSGFGADHLGNFDPAHSNPDAVSGNPAEAMEDWEYQGDTGRCALYSQKFVIEDLTHQKIDIEELADVAEKNGWFSEDSGTPLLNMDKMLHHYGINSDMRFHNDIYDIDKCLQNGGKVIVSVDADEIWYGEKDGIYTPGDGPNHAVEVIGIDRTNPNEPMVILNDSGSPNGCGEAVPMNVFLDAWEDGNCQMISCY